MTNIIKIPYKHPVVRDLAWVMTSPGLLRTPPEGQALVTDEWCQNTYAAHENHLHLLDKSPAPLLEVLAKSKSHRLGIYFEWLLRYWLEEILHVQQLGHNVPVFQLQAAGGKRTLGEFDFLFRSNKKQALQHWEVTVKFYLQKINEQGRPYWIGPGDQDRLDIKLNRLFQHQLKLAEFPEAKACLSDREVASVQPAGFIKGYLFYPLANDGTYSPHPAGDATLSPCTLSAMHNKGWWMHWGTLPLPTANTDERWVVLAKPRWLSPVCHTQNEEFLMNEAGLIAYCEKHFSDQDRPLLVASLQWNSEAWLESSRGFVLPPE